MPSGTRSDFVIYQPEFWSGVSERLAEITDVFNSASLNCIRLTARSLKGDFEANSFIKRVAAGISARRIDTSTSAVTDTKLEMGEHIAIKVKRRLGPVSVSDDAWIAAGLSPSEFSFRLGVQIADDVAQDYLATAVRALRGAILGVTGAVLNAGDDTTAGSKLSTSALNDGNALFGDRSDSIRCYVMHSRPWHDLVGTALTANILDITGIAVREGNTPTLGRRAVITDNAAMSFAATAAVDNIAADGTNSKFTGTGVETGISVGQYVQIAGFAASGNNRVYRVTATGAGEITVDGTVVTEVAATGQTSTGLKTYLTFGLTEDAVDVVQSEERRVVTDTITGEENLRERIQGEHSYNLNIKGHSYDKTTLNPTDANLIATAKWTQVLADVKDTAGVVITHV